MANKRPVMLMILDGWGLRPKADGNAIAQGNTPNYDRWTVELERSIVDASGEAVGLVPGQMGNSEVGHLNLGAGRVVFQDISRINNAISDGDFFELEPLVKAADRVKAGDGKLHMAGLLGDGGVHAHDDHLYALLRFAKEQGVKPILHIITDGRDTSPGSAADFLQNLRDYTSKNDIDYAIGTLGGRYYYMDRDQRWERTKLAFDAVVNRSGETATSAEEALQQSFDANIYDEFILPTVIENEDNVALEAEDSLILYNFRADRMRQIAKLSTMEAFDGRPDVALINDLHVVTMTTYAPELPVDVLFGMNIVDKPLAEVLADNGLKQFHSAETEKYPHVTYFFNGRQEKPFEGEDREIVPSPKVATYDLQPEMSAPELAELMLSKIESDTYDFLLINFANPDMVGHTGSLEAAIKAVETVDDLAGKLVEAVVAKGGVAIVTADHGNCDRMIDHFTGEPHTYHTTQPVPLFVIGDGYYGLRPRGKLADVAPTVLDLLGLEKPSQMTGESLIEHPGA